MVVEWVVLLVASWGILSAANLVESLVAQSVDWMVEQMVAMTAGSLVVSLVG